MNTYTRLANGNWGIKLSLGSLRLEPGTEVVATRRNGANNTVTLGAHQGFRFGQHTYAIAQTASEIRAEAQVEAQAHAPQVAAPPMNPSANVGDISRITEIFNNARTHLRSPSIVLTLPEENETIELAPNAVGGINVHSATRRARRRRGWGRPTRGASSRWFFYGTISAEGTFAGRPELFVPATRTAAIANRLTTFVADPVATAGADGRLAGRCCFCRLPLTDERSTSVGYGPVCADHFGLPWGDRPARTIAPTVAQEHRVAPAAPAATETFAQAAQRDLDRLPQPRRATTPSPRWWETEGV